LGVFSTSRSASSWLSASRTGVWEMSSLRATLSIAIRSPGAICTERIIESR
jgi:hypothetical protein